jgi:hypothetical protein
VRKYILRSLYALTVGAGILVIAGLGCDSSDCENATNAMKASITAVCGEAEFVHSPFCQCCVPNGYFSINDSCQCTQLILDTDFCWYDETSAGYPAVRNALSYASNVCQNRAISVPYADVNTAMCPNQVVLVSDSGTTPSDAAPSDAPTTSDAPAQDSAVESGD